MDTQHWTNFSTVAPVQLSYHSANLMGNYMVVYGGQKIRRQSSSCINKNLYAYHLVCHKWVEMDELYESLGIVGKCVHSHMWVV